MTEQRKQYKSKAVFLDTQDGKVYNKVYGGIPFTIEKLPDFSIKAKVAEQETEVSSPQSNDYGTYFIISAFGGKGFVSFRESKDGNGDYCMIKLSEDCKLPPPPGGSRKAPLKKQYNKAAAAAGSNAKPW
jgi:hypothetical protein